MNRNLKAYLVGGEIGCMEAAAFMTRDGHLTGANIGRLEAAPVMVGSQDGAEDPISRWVNPEGARRSTM